MEEDIVVIEPAEEQGGNRTYIFLGIFLVAGLLLVCCCLTIFLAWFFGDLVLTLFGMPLG